METHRERQENDQLEQELTAVDESLHLRAYMNFSSASLPLTQVQTSQTGIARRELLAFATSVRRIVQICFVCALILFLVLVSLLTYTRATHRGNSITRGQQVYATPRITTKPTPEQNGSWQELPSPPSPEADNTATYVQLQGKAYIYMNGGYRGPKDRPHYDRAFYRYDIANAHWQTLADANAPGMVNNAAALDEQGNLFFTTGYSSDTYAVTSLLYKYQPDKGTFQQIVPPVQMPIGFAGAMFDDGHGHLYITRGFMATNPQTPAGTGWYRYDIDNQQWQQLAPLPQGLGYVILAPDNEGNILLLGGATDAGASHPTMRIYRYNIAHNTWSDTLSTAPIALSGAASCLDGSERLIVIGGYATNHTTSLNTAWQVNLQTLSWTPLASLSDGGSLLGAAACDGHGHVFLLRGANDPARPTPDFWELTLPS